MVRDPRILVQTIRLSPFPPRGEELVFVSGDQRERKQVKFWDALREQLENGADGLDHLGRQLRSDLIHRAKETIPEVSGETTRGS